MKYDMILIRYGELTTKGKIERNLSHFYVKIFPLN